jgi:membrane associated rhomboid family serine protease
MWIGVSCFEEHDLHHECYIICRFFYSIYSGTVWLLIWSVLMSFLADFYFSHYFFFRLIKMGGLYLTKVLHTHQVWRLFSSIWLHEGLSQLLTDATTILGVGITLERKYGFGTFRWNYFLYIIKSIVCDMNL